MRRIELLLVALLMGAFSAPVASAQGVFGGASQASDPDSAAPAVLVDSSSPRVSVRRYLEAARDADFEEAARWLEFSTPEARARGEELASRLKTVLDAHLWLDLDRLSPSALGDTTDGLPRNREQLGEIEQEGDRTVPVRLSQIRDDGAVRWVFSAATVAEVDALYRALPDYWIRDHLPDALLRRGPFEVLWWQWLALLTLLPLAALIGWLITAPILALLRRAAARTRFEFDDALIASARGPLILALGVAASRVLLYWIALAAPAQAVVVGLQKAIIVVAFFWLLLRALGALQSSLPLTTWGSRHPALRSLIPLFGRVLRVVVFVLGLLTVIAQFGYPIATILAGLGIGGIAVALGAQKSFEHFFGSVSISVDQPFRVGDWVSAGGVSGSIESIGLRSTRIRTLARTIVTVPNGVLAEQQSENFGARDRMVLKAVLGLEYGTSSRTLRKIRDEIEAYLSSHARVHDGKAQVYFTTFAPSSLDIDVLCWLTTTDAHEFKVIQQELFLRIMEIVEENGSSFAFPTQTVMVRTADNGGARRPTV